MLAHSRPGVFTVAQMRAAEQALIDGGETVESLMDRAGTGAAEWVFRVAAGRPVTVLCGPGNNGGDGYVIARELHRRGLAVTVVAPLEPKTPAAIATRAAWGGATAPRGNGGVLIDCLFGSGLARALEPEIASLLWSESLDHAFCVAVDLPSGIDGDSGQPLNDGLPGCDLTLALGGWKPAHWLMPAMTLMGERRLVPIGIPPEYAGMPLARRPRLDPPRADAHKYTRGFLGVIGGAMPGAGLLAARAAMRGGAGYVKLFAENSYVQGPPDLVIESGVVEELVADGRLDALVIGPGLGRHGLARERLEQALARELPTVVDGDALVLLDPAMLAARRERMVLTPHAGELERLFAVFGIEAGDRFERLRALAHATRSVVVAKAPDTLIAGYDGLVTFAGNAGASSWLSTAGTGDVLAGLVGSRIACGRTLDAAAQEAVWLHAEAARQAGPAFAADDLVGAIPRAYAELL